MSHHADPNHNDILAQARIGKPENTDGQTAMDKGINGIYGHLDSENLASVLKQLRERGFLQTVFNTIHEGIVVVDRRLRIRYANKAAFAFLGLPENAVNQHIGRFIRDVKWDDIFSEKEDEWYKTSRREIEVLYPVPRRLMFYIVPHQTERGTAVIILHDITEAVRSTTKKIETEKMHMISLLAAGVAHEIGNPLNSLGLHLQLLRRLLEKDKRRKTADEATELLTIAENEARRLNHIIREFLQAVRPVPLELRPVNLEEITGEVLNLNGQEIADRLITVKSVWPEDTPPVVLGDENQLKQAIYNIVKNAMQAMPGGGTLSINCRHLDNEAEISFADTGIGISPEHIANIFDPYYTTRSEGSGLGLMIVERIIRDHGARISVDSGVGKGTTFTISFPLNSKKVRLLPPA